MAIGMVLGVECDDVLLQVRFLLYCSQTEALIDRHLPSPLIVLRLILLQEFCLRVVIAEQL